MDGKDESPARGLKNMLSRSRRGKDEVVRDRADSRSTRGDSSESGPEKFKPRPSIVGSDVGSGNAGRTRRKSKPTRKGTGDNSPITNVPTSAGFAASDGGSINGSTNDADEGSTMTSDSEGERAFAASRLQGAQVVDPNSHSGYLTSSSPQVKTTSVEVLSQTRNGDAITNMAGESTLSINSADSGRSNRSRSISPGTKIKEVLKPGFKKQNEAGDLSKSTTPPPPLTNAFGKEKESDDSLASRRLSRATIDGAPSPAPLQTYDAGTNQSNKSLPSIVMTPETPPPVPHGLYDKALASSYEKLPPLVHSPEAVDKQHIADELSASRTSSSSETRAKMSTSSFMSFAHRRVRSDSQTTHPSKLSQSMNPPLTPMIEEVRTPPSSSSRNPSMSSGGFFTSVFSAAQNAASTLTNTLSNPTNRPRSSASQHPPTEEEGEQNREQLPGTEPVMQPKGPLEDASGPHKPLAIDTIGSGELSLSHLGIATEASPLVGGSPTPSTPADPFYGRSRSGTVIRREEAAAREEGLSAARAVSAAYEERPDDAPTPMVEDVDEPKAAPAESSAIGEKPTPNGSVVDVEASGVLRSNSLKNKIGSKRRHRGGSQSTIGAALAASGSSLISHTNTNSSQRLAGFAVASKKRNRDFHALFRSVPEDDYLIEDYSCALQRDIILAGRIYISEGHICFSSNILGWVTTLVISFDEVVSVEKESTAMVFPNAIAVQTLHARHTFRSLLSRETTYDLLIGIWKINHPHLLSSENGVRVASGTGSKTEKLDTGHSDNESEGSGDDDMDDDASEGSDDGQGSSILSGEATIAPPDASASPPKSTIPKKPSNVGLAAGQASSPPTVGDAKAAAQANGAAIAVADFPGPANHGPTECSDQGTHYPNLLKDEVIPAALGKIYSMVFGNASGGFMSRWLLDEQKVTDLQMDDDKKGLGEDNRSRSYSYIRPLGGSIGPKQTKCIITEQIDSFDLEKAVSVTVTTQTPDVPSGNVFSTKTRYCLMWGPNNTTRMIMTCVIEWTGKSWLKGPIEKGANDGQSTYANDLCRALRAAVSKGKPAAGTPSKRKSKKKRTDAEKSTTSLAASTETKKSDWGMFEPVHGILGPVVDVVSPLLTIHALVAVLSILLLYSWLLRGSTTSSSLPPRTSHAARMAAYEELWRSEEAALWTWLEQRIGGDEGLVIPIGSTGRGRTNADRSKAAQHERQQVLKGENGRFMAEQEIRRAVEITEEKLRGLKEAVKMGNRVVNGMEEKMEKVGEL